METAYTRVVCRTLIRQLRRQGFVYGELCRIAKDVREYAIPLRRLQGSVRLADEVGDREVAPTVGRIGAWRDRGGVGSPHGAGAAGDRQIPPAFLGVLRSGAQKRGDLIGGCVVGWALTHHRIVVGVGWWAGAHPTGVIPRAKIPHMRPALRGEDRLRNPHFRQQFHLRQPLQRGGAGMAHMMLRPHRRQVPTAEARVIVRRADKAIEVVFRVIHHGGHGEHGGAEKAKRVAEEQRQRSNL